MSIRRLRDAWADHAPVEAVSGFARGGVVVGALVALLVLGIGFGERGSETVAAVKAPTFAKSPRAAAPAPASAAIEAPSRLADSDSRRTSQTLEYVQSFLRDADTPKRLCRDLAIVGFSQARWTKSELFSGGWECASPLVAADESMDRAFIVVRGSNQDNLRSVMLKLNPVSERDRQDLVVRASRVFERFARTSGMLLAPEAYRRIAEWKPGKFVGSSGTVHIVAEHGRAETRVINLVVSASLLRPMDDGCSQKCRAWMGALIASSKRPVKIARR